jgi:hypothetical protein
MNLSRGKVVYGLGLAMACVLLAAGVYAQARPSGQPADQNGVSVKIPFTWQSTWVDGQYTVNLVSVQPNVAIDAARFAKPAPPR